MIKLFTHSTTETTPSGTTLTTLHLTPEAKRGLSTNGARIPAPTVPAELTAYDHQQRMGKFQLALHIGTIVAIVLAFLGVQPVACVMIPSCIVGIQSARWARRDLQALKQRRLMAEVMSEECHVCGAQAGDPCDAGLHG